MILALPLPALAESFTVTTNKDIYTSGEKAIIVGTIPEDAPSGYAVLVRVTGSKGDCAAMNILPAADNSFTSRPFRLDGCGFGEFTVSAFYADQETASSFTISNSSQTDGGSNLELRVLKNVVLQAQEAVNTRVKELIEDGYVLPEQVVGKYSEGVSQASLALQAIEFRDTAGAKKHMIFALRDFREVLNALSEENVAKFEQSTEQQAANTGSSDIVGTYRMLVAYYHRLEELAEKNHVDIEDEFKDAAFLLSNAKRLIDEDNFEGAERNLKRVYALLEAIRANLVKEEEGEKLASYANTTSPQDEELARKLAHAADKFERDALELLNQTGADAEMQAKVQEALSLITRARANIEAQDLESAKDALSAAHSIIEKVRDSIEDEDDKASGNSGHGSRESSNDEDNSGSGSGKDEENKGSGTGGSNDEDDQ
jgi:flagellin-specific chaperone FliS